MSDGKRIQFTENLYARRTSRGWNLYEVREKKRGAKAPGEMTTATIKPTSLSYTEVVGLAIKHMGDQCEAPEWKGAIEHMDRCKETVLSAVEGVGAQVEAQASEETVKRWITANPDRGEDMLMAMRGLIGGDLAELVSLAGLLVGGWTNEVVSVMGSEFPDLDWSLAVKSSSSQAGE